MHRINSLRVMCSLARRTWLASLVVLLGCCLAPALAQAQTVTLGPPMTNAGAEESCPTMPGGGPPVAFPDCAYVNSAEPTGVIAQAPADGTITTWRIDGFQGTARLLVLQATGGGGYEVVQRSAATPDEPCVTANNFCGPSLTPYVFTTDLPIKQGQYLGVEAISGANCDGTPDQPNPCTFIGIGPNGSASQYFDTAPAANTPTVPSGNDTGRLVNADEVTGPTVSLSLAPSTITADGVATTIATAAVTDNGAPVTGDTVSITSADTADKVGPVTDNGDGTYTAAITSSETVGTPTITATDVSSSAQASATATLTQAPPRLKIAVKPTSIKANGKSTATATVTLTGVNGEAVPGQAVGITASGPATVGPVRDRGNGTYTATITATHKAGHATLTATDTSVDPSVSGVAQLKLTAVPKHPPHPHHPKTCIVPKLAGDTLAKATSALRRARCGAAKIVLRKSAKVRKGRVIFTNPKAGKRSKKGRPVTIVVSAGSRVVKAMCKVPKLRGATLAAARRALSRAHCDVGKVTRRKSAKVATGRVISSSPGAGSKHRARTRVNLTVSRGKH